MKKVEFRPGDLSEKAFEAYSGSDLTFWKEFVDNDWYVGDMYYVGESKGTAERVGTIKQVEEFLLCFE